MVPAWPRQGRPAPRVRVAGHASESSSVAAPDPARSGPSCRHQAPPPHRAHHPAEPVRPQDEDFPDQLPIAGGPIECHVDILSLRSTWPACSWLRPAAANGRTNRGPGICAFSLAYISRSRWRISRARQVEWLVAGGAAESTEPEARATLDPGVPGAASPGQIRSAPRGRNRRPPDRHRGRPTPTDHRALRRLLRNRRASHRIRPTVGDRTRHAVTCRVELRAHCEHSHRQDARRPRNVATQPPEDAVERSCRRSALTEHTTDTMNS